MALNRTVPGAGAPGIHARSDRGSEAGSHAESPWGAGLSAISSGQRARWTLGSMAGRSAPMERLFLQMRYLGKHLRLALIEGERGTGKLLTAETLHGLSLSRSGGFTACPAAQFLGEGNPAARIEQAREGTLYLSQVDALNHEQQGRLLHLLAWVQQQHARHGLDRRAPGGLAQQEFSGAMPRAVLVSSVRALRPMVLYGKFRSDLYQQLSAVRLVLPPLRDRREDIAMLAEVFVARCAAQYGRPLRGVAQDALPLLLAHSWPGNVGELEAVLSGAALRAEGEWLRGRDVVLPGLDRPAIHPGTSPGAGPGASPGTSMGTSMLLAPRPAARPGGQWTAPRDPAARPAGRADLADLSDLSGLSDSSALSAACLPGSGLTGSRDGALDPDLDPNLDRAILRHIRRVLSGADGNKLRAARLLGISRSTLYRMLDADFASSQSAGSGTIATRPVAVRPPSMLEQ